MNECEIQIRVKHDNIVLAYEYKELSNQIVLITEFIDGGNLSDLLGKNPKGLCEEKIQNLATGLMFFRIISFFISFRKFVGNWLDHTYLEN